MTDDLDDRFSLGARPSLLLTAPDEDGDPLWPALTHLASASAFLLYTLGVIVLLSAPALVIVAYRAAL